MRRADPSHGVSDGEGLPLPTYADSDVGSSPRSVGGVPGGRTGSLTEEPPPAVKWDDSAFTRVKLMCSYGGRILPRPHDNQLRYVGGESRIAVVSRSITFSELTTKLSRMFGSSVVIKYQLPYEDLDALISVTSDEDLDNMMEEYDRLQSVGNGNRGARLRVFLFPSKLERSQTASFSEMMENNHSRERWFVDILNGLPVLSRVRSETSSIVSETPDYAFQSNSDGLEEWAAAASYGNSVPSSTEQFSENKQGNTVSPAALFGSLLQQAGSNEATSAPGSPSPLKPKFTPMGSSSSAPPAVMSLLSDVADAASKGFPIQPTDLDGATGSYSSKTCLGSGDSSGSLPEQRKHVDSEILLTSDKSVLSSSVGGAEQLLPAGLMDDDDLSHKYSAKGSFDEVRESSETANLDAGVNQSAPEPSRAIKGHLASESTALLGQPIFDDEFSPTLMLARNLNVLQLDERVASPNILSPSSASSPSSQLLPPIPAPPQPMSKFGADEKHHGIPVSPRAGALLGSEDLVMQKILPASASNVFPGLKGDVEDGLSRQESPSFAHFLPLLIVPQQPLNAAGEGTLMPQALGVNTTKDVETNRVQVSTIGVSPVISPSLGPPTVQQKLPTTPVSNLLYQQSPVQGFDVPISAATYATQAPGLQPPFMTQIPTPVAGAVINPLPPIAAPVRPSNTAVAGRPAAGISRPQSPPVAASHHPSPLMPQVRTTSPPPMIPSLLVSNVSQSEALKAHAPISSNVVPSTIITSMGEGVRSNPYQQSEVVNIQRQVSDPAHGQRLAALTPQLGNQFSAPPAPGMPSRFRVVGHPIQQVADGIPLQQAPLVGIISEKKALAPMQRVGTNPSARPPAAPGGQYSYVSGIVQSPGALRYNAAPNIMTGAPATSPDTPPFNPFVDDFQGVSTYQDVLEAPPLEQQRRPMR